MMRERMVAIDPDAAPWEDYPSNVTPDGDEDDDKPIWGIWETGPNSPPDGDWGWCPVGPFGMTAAQAWEKLTQLEAQPYIPWPSLQELTEKIASQSLDADWLARFQDQVLWEVNDPYHDAVGPFKKWDDETELLQYLELLDIDWDEDEGRATLKE